MQKYLQESFSAKNLFFSFLFALCIYTWFYAPFPFTDIVLQQSKEIQPLLVFLLGWFQIRVVYDLGTMVYDAYFSKE